jgi:hypothetical protein
VKTALDCVTHMYKPHRKHFLETHAKSAERGQRQTPTKTKKKKKNAGMGPGMIQPIRRPPSSDDPCSCMYVCTVLIPGPCRRPRTRPLDGAQHRTAASRSGLCRCRCRCRPGSGCGGGEGGAATPLPHHSAASARPTRRKPYKDGCMWNETTTKDSALGMMI